MSKFEDGHESNGYTFTEQDFGAIATKAKSAFGLHLGPTKKPLVYSRLVRRLRARGLSSFADYCRLLDHPDEEAERASMISALTTNVTRFFREAHHFEILAREVLPSLVDEARSGGRVRLWSAGCSTGQEPYSMASTVLGRCPEAARLNVRILATDVDHAALRLAEAGCYDRDDVAGLTPQRRAGLFASSAGATLQVLPELRELVIFRPLNLLADWPMPGRFDAIFCRNVAIYFDKPTQERLWSRFAERLLPGGVLFIGHSERLSGQAAALFSSAGITAHRRGLGTPAYSKRNEWD